ncbi:hypothetical protein HCN44_009638 [Aphidius gifuensis]|uniref:Polycomb protein Sfmbt n=1 Tax=Aphidius gifuensis TaxID=684658 RepID=A0A835CZ33_APHGI|nr:polycomb protein Sfmbt-like [Aphidius gifuensis]KAF7998240.1 hypothetical protein HCN44_009638 [Aphidius gifuensis]
MNVCVNPLFASIPVIPELGMVWMGDMMVHDTSHELMMDPRHAAEGSYFTHGSNPFDNIRNHQMAPTTMLRYMPQQQQYTNECSETEETIEHMNPGDIVQDINQDYDNSNEINEQTDMNDDEDDDDDDDDVDEDKYMVMNDFIEEEQMIVNNAATQTQIQDNRNRKIKPIKHPGLVLKTPIAYQPTTDLNFIPIRKDGMAVCEKCGAIGVKHAFYTKERRFCSRACARSSEFLQSQTIHADSTNSPLHNNNNSSSSSLSLSLSSSSSSPPHSCDNKKDINLIEEDDKKNILIDKNINEPLLPDELPVRRKRTADMEGSYDWIPQLTEPGFCAAPVSCFKHAPISEIWDNISVGMKVEVENTDCDEVCEAFPDSFWVATVLRIAGYHALLRYEGFGNNEDKDFWVSLCSNDIHPVGWCATIGKPLIPPNTIANKYNDWKDFLMRRLTGARTLPTNFYNKVNDSMKSRFRCGLHLEVVDKNRISQVKVATIQKIVGKRLHVRYYDSPPDDNGFWCHEDSPLIHPVGWAKKVGQNIDAYPEYIERVDNLKFTNDDSTDNLFNVPKNHHYHYNNNNSNNNDSSNNNNRNNNHHRNHHCYKFIEGMKLEAIDPLNLSSICAATVMQVLRENYIMIRIDSYDEDKSGADWFCYNANSPCIFPIGFCAQNGLPLTPPKGYDPTTFTWDTYIYETNTIPAPIQLFYDIPEHGFVEGMRLEAADLMDPRLVCVATITRVIGRLLRVHFDGWEDEYDQWLDCHSPDIYPVGWCDLVDHKLESPRIDIINNNHNSNNNKINTSPTVKSPRGLKRKNKKRIKKNNNKINCVKNILIRHSERLGGLKDKDKDKDNKQQLKYNNNNNNNIIGHNYEPAQGTKIERLCEIESLPMNRTGMEPETAQEPAGPDQTLPSPTTGQGKSSSSSITINNYSDNNKKPPKERTATSYINVNSLSGKYIPRIADGWQKNNDCGELIPNEWNVFDVAQFLRVNDCATYCDNFSKRKIDGKTLLTLTKDQIIDLTGFKVGPSLKIFDLIQQLKIKVNPAQERLKLGLKKIL